MKKESNRESGLTKLERATLMSIARANIQMAVESRKGLTADELREKFDITPSLEASSGAFVTLRMKDTHRLRGCIGYIFPEKPLFLAVAENAVNAALKDPRFAPVAPEETVNIELDISVLTPPKPVSGPEEIIAGKHGVVLEKGWLKAVFLPQVATEQGWDRDTLLTNLSLKAGLGPEDWRSDAKFSVFTADLIFEFELIDK